MEQEKKIAEENYPLILRLQSLELDCLPEKYLTRQNRLQELYLDYNEVTILPNCFCENFNSLSILSLIGNQLKTLPDNVELLSHLEKLFLNENDLKHLPDGITNCRKLREINIVGNKLKHLPREFGELSLLERVLADENELKSLPDTFGLLSNLNLAEISHNKIKCLPENIGSLKKLRVLNLSNNEISDLPSSFGDLPNVERLDLSNNNIQGLTDYFQSSCCIKEIYLECNGLITLPLWINNLPAIEILSLKENRIQQKAFTEEFGLKCSKLKNLDLAGNFLTELPASIGELKRLEFIHLGSFQQHMERKWNFQNGNLLQKIPDSFSYMLNLKKINLDENNIGELPEDFGKLIHVEELNIGHNRLHELPKSFGGLKSLRICILSINNLELLPHNFGELCSLVELRLDNNMIAELPESFHRLSQLKILDLFNNRLKEIPDCLDEFPQLEVMDISENPFPIHHLRVPRLAKTFIYAPRDPNLKGTWRGDRKTDVKEIEPIVIESDREIPYEPEPEVYDTPYDSSVYRYAARMNTSLWKSHNESSSNEPRQKVIRNNRDPTNFIIREREYDTDDHPSFPNHYDSSDESFSECSLNAKSSCSSVTQELDGSRRSTPSALSGNQSEEEDWDKDDQNVNSINNKDNVQTYDEHLYIPSDFHPSSQVNMYIAPDKSDIIEGQFDDAEYDID